MEYNDDKSPVWLEWEVEAVKQLKYFFKQKLSEGKVELIWKSMDKCLWKIARFIFIGRSIFHKEYTYRV